MSDSQRPHDGARDAHERRLSPRYDVAWAVDCADGDNLNPGFGVRFIDLDADMRERLVSLVHAIAYLPSMPPPPRPE